MYLITYKMTFFKKLLPNVFRITISAIHISMRGRSLPLILSLEQVKLTVCDISSTETPEGQRLRVPQTSSQGTVWPGEFCVCLLMALPAFSVCTSWEVSWNIYLKVINKSGWFGGKTVKCNALHTYPEARIDLTRGSCVERVL